MSILIAFSLTVAILIALFIQDQIISTRRQIERERESAEWRAEMNEQTAEWINRMQREHDEWMRQSESDHENWMREFKSKANA